MPNRNKPKLWPDVLNWTEFLFNTNYNLKVYYIIQFYHIAAQILIVGGTHMSPYAGQQSERQYCNRCFLPKYFDIRIDYLIDAVVGHLLVVSELYPITQAFS